MLGTILKEQLKKLPAKPGIYLFSARGVSAFGGKNSLKNKYLYIGKALNLKNRVSQYLKTDDERLKKMILESKRVEFIKTDSDIEALILESQYIKKYKPDFNIMLRDDKQYGFVGFTEEEYPKIFITHQPEKNQNFIGPFTDIGALKTTLRLLRKIFPYCTCKQLHNNYCLNYHIEKCLGFCCLKNPNVSSIEYLVYKNNIRVIKTILSGGKTTLIKQLEKVMKNLSVKEEFEKALELQYKIAELKRVFENAKIIQDTRYKIQDTETAKYSTDVLKQLAKVIGLDHLPHRIEAYDIANMQGKHAVGAMVVFTNGQADKNQYRKFKIYTKHTPDDTAMLREILTRRFNHPEWPMPDLILVDGGKGQLHAADGVISKLQITNHKQIPNSKFQIPIIALTKNEKHIGEKIFIQNKKEVVPLSKLSTNLKNLLLQIDSEAHRFAISYYRQLHRKSLK